MNKNWFRNEALIMMFPLCLIIIGGIFAFTYVIYLNHFESSLRAESKIDPDFNTGYFFGQIEAIEINILVTYGDLDFTLNKSFQHKFKSSHVKRKISQLNGELLSVYIFKEQIPKNLSWPEELKVIIIEGNDTRKKMYKIIKQKRIENNWIDEDPEYEKRISEMLDIYIEYGNPYKLK